MSEVCDIFDKWDGLDAHSVQGDERGEPTDYPRHGGDPDQVTYKDEAPPDNPDNRRRRHRETDTMYIAPGFTEQSGRGDDAVAVIAHESRHVIQDQMEETPVWRTTPRKAAASGVGCQRFCKGIC